MHGDIERLAEEEMARINAHYSELDKLRDEPACAVLREAERRGVLTGTTRDQWDRATAAIQAADSRLGKWRATVIEASRLLRASPPDPGRAERLLRDRSIRLTPAEIPKVDRQPPALSYSDPRFSLRTLGDYVTADLRTARAALTELRDKLDDLRRQLGAYRKEADPEERERDLLRGRLEVYRRRDRRRGHAGPALDVQGRRARKLLDAEPCDLRQAAEAVHEYIVMERGDPPEPGNHER